MLHFWHLDRETQLSHIKQSIIILDTHFRLCGSLVESAQVPKSDVQLAKQLFRFLLKYLCTEV